MTHDNKQALRDRLYNNHAIADYEQDDPFVGIYFDSLVELMDDYKYGKLNFKIGDKVIIHCNDTRDEYKHKFYDNQVGKIIHIYDLDRNPWGNIVVILENMMQNGFFAEELEPIPSENNKEDL